jgi:hypothetical protein
MFQVFGRLIADGHVPYRDFSIRKRPSPRISTPSSRSYRIGLGSLFQERADFPSRCSHWVAACYLDASGRVRSNASDGSAVLLLQQTAMSGAVGFEPKALMWSSAPPASWRRSAGARW